MRKKLFLLVGCQIYDPKPPNTLVRVYSHYQKSLTHCLLEAGIYKMMTFDYLIHNI